MALQSKSKICPSDIAIIPAGFCDLLTVFSSETPLQYKLINTTFASIAYNKSVMIAIFLGTQSPSTTQLYIVVIFLSQFLVESIQLLFTYSFYHTELSFYFFGAYFRMFICLIIQSVAF